ncbi:hypothetical protein BTO32_16230 [Marinobacter lutaoensis]|uniref:Uncharacterized protein n=1 Tax=Marinobacter lutaoensis TaxID=135739 RepID=A0A1V2DNW9_9GAMM|nr:hypothetical protein [Marinobacter lutaoensis]ONF42338.1 hypothetical protein BTO32_16230 [Marinobacter lutaoensis]
MSWFRIFSAVLVANIVSWVIVSIIGWLVFFVFFDALDDELARRMSSIPEIEFPEIVAPPPLSPQDIKAQKERERLRKEQLAREARQAQLRRENEANARRINRQTCDFWRQQYREDPSSQNEAYMNSACSRL